MLASSLRGLCYLTYRAHQRSFNAAMTMLTNPIYLDPNEVRFQSVAASGPGGQNVNKSNSKVEARINIDQCSAIDDKTRERLIKLFRRRITKDNELYITCQDSRSGEENKAHALKRLQSMIQEAKDAEYLEPPPVVVHTESRAREAKRIQDKRLHSQKKRERKDSRWYG
eukprot:NODE_9032_length_667_cov_19.645221_g8769_i0.p1 GENE.NODE_9032_length_667_cov_19.645221_g8769_i0~~NODE_9032_length_667_cov_19.645221_g8769_i0.p1  ORF type:complete len:194 (-),score=23.10 NODE_9032_length_667_cov_19.645221_g8769_i0:86-592(-)